MKELQNPIKQTRLHARSCNTIFGKKARAGAFIRINLVLNSVYWTGQLAICCFFIHHFILFYLFVLVSMASQVCLRIISEKHTSFNQNL